jgi:Amt family ammonium transporter
MQEKEIIYQTSPEVLAQLEAATAAAAKAQESADLAQFMTNNMWIFLAAALVFIMHLGFASLEAGFVQKKNVVNILFKNSMIIAIGLLTYCLFGFDLMYPGEFNGWFSAGAFSSPGLEPTAEGMTSAYADYTYYSDFIFQAMFAATCATIVSGAVAERIKLSSFLLFATIFVAISYPITGAWKWGAGWLDQRGFYDFAGSTIVHSVGGWAALAGIILVGPRVGKYTAKGMRPITGHSMPLAAIGVFLLWFGWFGFNGGSVLSADPGAVSLVFTTTSMAAAAGAIGAFIASKILFKSNDLSMVLNGILGGLVGITAGADVMTVTDSIIVGFIAGIIIPLSVSFFDKLKLDDPVGATSVHLVCGIWGTGYGSFSAQIIGILSIGVFTFTFAFILFYIIKLILGLRVNEEEEEKGLDIMEHELTAYS